MVTWIIFAHNLWEKKQNYRSQRLRFMYNATTITTLSVSVLMFYIGMFILFSIAVMIFVPGETFQSVLKHDVNIIDYAKLAWLVTSAATVAGAIGAGLENEESVRRITYRSEERRVGKASRSVWGQTEERKKTVTHTTR